LGRIIGFVLLLAILAGASYGVYYVYNRYFADVRVAGRVVDAETGRPLENARVTLSIPASGPMTTGPDGQFGPVQAKRGIGVSASATGYLPDSAVAPDNDPLEIALTPRTVTGIVRDAYSAAPIARALLSTGVISTTTDAGGSFRLTRTPEAGTITATAVGYDTGAAPLPSAGTVEFSLRPNSLRGKVLDAKTGRPVANAVVQSGGNRLVTDANGLFRMENVPMAHTVSVIANGYQGRQITVERQSAIEVGMEPVVVRAPYVTFYGIGNRDIRRKITGMLDTTELNGIVIDVKGDRGLVSFRSDVTLTKEIGAQQLITLPDAEDLLSSLRKRGVYTIARIVVFKDDLLGKARPNWAIKDSRTSAPWVDGEGLIWVDPMRKEVWEYNVALAKEAINKGFDEVQFDYIRFPTDPSADTSVSHATYSKPNTTDSRVAAISGFLALAQSELKPLGGFISVDVFGYACWKPDDLGIGQHLETMATYVDYISPMVYPSTFDGGLPTDPPTYTNAPAFPYEIVFESLKLAAERLKNTNARLRPWLQYFDDYPWATGRVYTAADIEAQKRAASDSGSLGWMIWDPYVIYDKGGIGPKVAPTPGPATPPAATGVVAAPPSVATPPAGAVTTPAR
jgi:hypothetical protein